MHFSNETAGQAPTDLAPEIDDTELADEALDRATCLYTGYTEVSRARTRRP
jgi:hypothetical protein